jgi:hypothetical protein
LTMASYYRFSTIIYASGSYQIVFIEYLHGK